MEVLAEAARWVYRSEEVLVEERETSSGSFLTGLPVDWLVIEDR